MKNKDSIYGISLKTSSSNGLKNKGTLIINIVLLLFI